MNDLVNLTDYTILEMSLFAFGCWLWVVAYGVMIRNIHKYKFVEMPLLAGLGNFSWEFVWSWVYETDMGQICVWAYKGWFFLDLYIVFFLIKYAKKQQFSPLINKHITAISIYILVVLGLLFTFVRMQGLDTVIGANTAYPLNLFISVLYVMLIARATNPHQFSPWIAWMKMIGTGTNTVFMFLHYPDNYFVHTVGVNIFIIDMIYIYLLNKRRKDYFLKLINI
jgi:hypothetical protein